MAQSESKRPRIATRTVDEPAGTVTFKFADGRTLVASLAEMAAIGTRLALHGLSQKVGDAFADAKGDVEVAFLAARDTIASLVAGTWSERGTGSSEAEAPTLTCAAIARALGKDAAKVSAVYAKLPEAQQKALRSRADVKAALAEIRAERAKAQAATTPTVDVGGMFD